MSGPGRGRGQTVKWTLEAGATLESHTARLSLARLLHWPDCHTGQTVTQDRLSLARLSPRPDCHWQDCYTGQTVTLARLSYWPDCHTGHTIRLSPWPYYHTVTLGPDCHSRTPQGAINETQHNASQECIYGSTLRFKVLSTIWCCIVVDVNMMTSLEQLPMTTTTHHGWNSWCSMTSCNTWRQELPTRHPLLGKPWGSVSHTVRLGPDCQGRHRTVKWRLEAGAIINSRVAENIFWMQSKISKDKLDAEAHITRFNWLPTFALFT